ncbi:LacI family DNA-binding transcriptional regulator [Geminisphaera colitermitum]|uniref:LacI family DNA-binding transcriptional regulator n=1 Tax=Geminisphaera colitermitum TaxID=1148786 RepID=UPI001E47BF75|nr:LacI family DNA-binding transcriptional regulator [Geminisphaera colitermitum]
MKLIKRVTMAHVAAAAGVHVMTVSRALRNSPVLPQETRERIRKIANKLGYRPDAALSQLMSRVRSSQFAANETIAWITTGPTAGAWRENSASIANYQGAKAHGESLGYRVEEFWLDAPGMNGARLSGILRHRSIRGLLISPLDRTGHPLELEWDYFAAATCGGYTVTAPGLHRACSHHLHAARTAFQSLHRLGYQRVGMAMSEINHQRVAGLWLAGAFLEQQYLPRARRVPPLVAPCWDADALLRWYRKHQPDAIISFDKACDWLSEAGVDVPGACGFALLDITKTGFASVDEQRRDVGAAALDLVIEQLNLNRRGLPDKPKIVLVECKWRDGETAPPRRPITLFA